MGQAKKNRRACPALGEPIPVLVCAEGAGSRIACPRDCPHFPFAEQRYDDVGAIVGRAKDELAERFGSTPERREFVDFIIRGEPRMADWQRYLHALLHERDAAGQTFFAAWEREGWLGVRNDRRLVLRSLAAVRLRLLQVERVQDDTILFVRDLLDAEDAPLLEMRDRELCRNVPLRSAFFAPLGPLAHYHMGWLFARPVPHLPTTGPRGLALQLAQHLGYEGDAAGFGAWLEQNLARFDAALTEVQRLTEQQAAGAAASVPPESTALLPSGVAEEARRLGELGGWDALAGPSENRRPPDPHIWLEAPNAWLGTTPRAAAADPARAGEVRRQLEGLIVAADHRRLHRQAFPDWSGAAAELGWPELRHTLPAGWLPPRAGERRDDDRLRANWPADLRESSDSEPPGVVLSSADLAERAEAQRGRGEPDALALSAAFADVIGFLLVETDDWEPGNDAPKVALHALLEVCLGAWGTDTRRYGIIPGRVRERREAIETRMADFATQSGAEDAAMRTFTQNCRQPALAELAIAGLLRADQQAPEADPTDLVALLPIVLALVDEIDTCVAAWTADHPPALPS